MSSSFILKCKCDQLYFTTGQLYIIQYSDYFGTDRVNKLRHYASGMHSCPTVCSQVQTQMRLHTLASDTTNEYLALHELFGSLQVVVSICMQSGCRQVKQSLWWSKDGHLSLAQQQPPREVPPVGSGDIAGYTRHVQGWGADVQSETLAELGLLSGLDSCSSCLTGLCLSPSVQIKFSYYTTLIQ